MTGSASTNGRPPKTARQRGLAAKRKGQAGQLAIRKAWEASIGPVIVPIQEAEADDLVDVVNGISIECKNVVRTDLAGWTSQSARAAEARGGLIPIVVHKRVGTTDVGRWYVTMEFRWFAHLIWMLKRLQRRAS